MPCTTTTGADPCDQPPIPSPCGFLFLSSSRLAYFVPPYRAYRWAIQVKARLAAKKKKADDGGKKKLAAIMAAEAKARKAKLGKQKDASKFNQARCWPRLVA